RAHRIAEHGRPRREVQRAARERDPRAPRATEMRLEVSPPVARGVAERQDAAGPTAPVFQGDEQVAVGRDREVSRRAHLVCDDEGTEGWRVPEAAVAGVAGGV